MLHAQLISDVHSRFAEVRIHKDAHILLAVGDISDSTHGVEWLAGLDMPTIYVPGNHEFYDGDLGDRLDELEYAAQGTKITIASNKTVSAAGVKFICSTLWSDYGNLDPVQIQNSASQLNDFRKIRVAKWMADEINQKRYLEALAEFEAVSPQMRGIFPKSPDHMNAIISMILHRDSINFISTELAKHTEGITVVLTHHAPTTTSLHFAGYFTVSAPKHFKELIPLKHRPHKIGAYSNSLEYIMENFKVDYWCHGHLHESLRYSMHGTDVITNPTGYTDTQNPKHSPSLIIKFGDKSTHSKILSLMLYHSLNLQIELLKILKNNLINGAKNTTFNSQDDFLIFADIYNQTIAPLKMQTKRDCNRPDYILSKLNMQSIFGIAPESAKGMQSTHRNRFVHEMITIVSLNEKKTKDWLTAVQGRQELSKWTVEGDI